MSEEKKLNMSELEAISGGWDFDELSPEDQKKCLELSQDLFDAGGLNYEPECRQRWEEFDAYLCRKYGVG